MLSGGKPPPASFQRRCDLQGVPLTRRSTFYAGVLPNRITIYRGAICAVCNSDSEVVEKVRRTVIHEVGHHFGIGDARLRELGARAEGHGGVRWSFLLWTGLRRRRSSQSIS